MSDKGKICFSQEAQKHDWNFEEGASGFASPGNVGKLADQLHQTVLGSARRSELQGPPRQGGCSRNHLMPRLTHRNHLLIFQRDGSIIMTQLDPLRKEVKM